MTKLPTPEEFAMKIEQNTVFPKVDRFIARNIVALRDAQIIARLEELKNELRKNTWIATAGGCEPSLQAKEESTRIKHSISKIELLIIELRGKE